jgi:hypothetical protein
MKILAQLQDRKTDLTMNTFLLSKKLHSGQTYRTESLSGMQRGCIYKTCRHGELYLKRKITKKKNLLNFKERRNEKIRK